MSATSENEADALFELLEAFDDLLAGLNGDWRLHRELFQDPLNFSLFAESSPMIWQILGDSLVDRVLMSIARLLDPPQSCGKPNLSITRVLSHIASGPERDEIAEQFQELRANFDVAVRHWRNKRLSHNDLGSLTGVEPMPKLTYDEISGLIDAINKIGRKIGHVAQGIDKSFVPHVMNADWVWRLIRTLEAGVQQRSSALPKKRETEPK